MAKNTGYLPYPLGARREDDGVTFSFASGKKDCGILLYDRESGRQKKKLAFSSDERLGNIYTKHIKLQNPGDLCYLFYEEEEKIPDVYAKAFKTGISYGKKCKEEELKAFIPEEGFDWEDDKNPEIPYKDAICYCLHVRGFTAHTSSGVKHKGTFAGLMEKIPYLKATGITTVELQPVYEFIEYKDAGKPMAYGVKQEERLNYWGYTKGYYYAPKAAYSATADSVTEFKELVKAFHKNGLEVVLQFYFPADVRMCDIPEILRFWVLTYHVDGFHLMGEHLPADALAQDPLLAETKLWYHGFDIDRIYGPEAKLSYENLAVYQDQYLFDMRRFLKGDEGMLGTALYHMRTIPRNMGRIHFFSNYYGMTLMDMVSFDRKHNEENGENNRDGSDYNCSWNCGEEGTTRKKKIQKLRIQQIKNAMMFLFFSHSTPLIFMGDEFGNSQSGNNNPYCQDNEITWLNWKDLDRNKEIYEFFKSLVSIRNNHPVLKKDAEPRLMDYISCGYPDVSYHGEKAWQPSMEVYERSAGILYCGSYGRHRSGEEDNFLYLGINMHWEPCKLALPRLPKGYKWERRIVTGSEDKAVLDNKVDTLAEMITVNARSIALYVGVMDENARKMSKSAIKRKERQPF